MWIDRHIEALLRRRAATRPVVVLTGARQTGKTSLMRRLFPDHAFATLDLPSEAEQAERDPGTFLARHPPPVILDEVQYAPGLFRHLKAAVDRERSRYGAFLLTGSQPLGLMKSVSDSLAGRAGTAFLAAGRRAVGDLRLRRDPPRAVEPARRLGLPLLGRPRARGRLPAAPGGDLPPGRRQVDGASERPRRRRAARGRPRAAARLGAVAVDLLPGSERLSARRRRGRRAARRAGCARRLDVSQRMSQSSVCGPDRYSTRPSPCTIVSSSRRMVTGCPPHSGTGAVTENSSEIHSPARSGNRGWAP